MFRGSTADEQSRVVRRERRLSLLIRQQGSDWLVRGGAGVRGRRAMTSLRGRLCQ